MPLLRQLLFAPFLFTLAMPFPAGAAAPRPELPAGSPAKTNWVPTWVSAQQLTEPHNMPPEPGLSGNTLRQVLQPTLVGDRARIVLSNQYGETPLTLNGARIARARDGGRIDPESEAMLTFNGREEATILPGLMLFSDPVDFEVVPFEQLAVTLHLGDVPEQLTGHPGSRTTSYIAPGAALSDEDLTEAVSTERWYLLAAVEVRSTPEARAIVVVGDSITDGRGSTTDQNDRWPDVLARRLHASPGTEHIAVLNQGAGGGRMLRYGLGTAALARLDRDVLAQPGVEALVVCIGVNDIGTAPGEPDGASDLAQELIAAYKQVILRAHRHGIRVIGTTIMPFKPSFYYTPHREALRQRVNHWIRNSGAFDGVIDFDAITRDPENPEQLAAEVDGGDHLHPSAAGYRIMAEAIDLELFRR